MLKRIKIGELIKQKKAHSQTGPFGTQLKASDYVDYGTPVINVRNIGFGDIRENRKNKDVCPQTGPNDDCHDHSNGNQPHEAKQADVAMRVIDCNHPDRGNHDTHQHIKQVTFRNVHLLLISRARPANRSTDIKGFVPSMQSSVAEVLCKPGIL